MNIDELLTEAMGLSGDIEKATRSIQGHLRIKEQLEASSCSVFANLSELRGPLSNGEKKQRLRTSITEAHEAESWLKWFSQTGLLDPTLADQLAERMVTVRKRLYGLLRSIG